MSVNRTGIGCRFVSNLSGINSGTNADRERSTAVFRILQEALTNVARHANATRVSVNLCEKANNLMLEVRDNGRGIADHEIFSVTSLGLLGMRERALLVDGEVSIKGMKGRGTTVIVRIPLDKCKAEYKKVGATQAS